MNAHPWQGNGMITPTELSSRAALCRKLAQREPNSKVYWLAEAEKWLRLCHKPIHLERTGDKDPLEQFLARMNKRSRP
jgi:hypothetical protein